MSCDCPPSSLTIERNAEHRVLGNVRRHYYVVWKCESCGELYTCECFRGVMETVSKPGWQRSIPGYLTETRIGLGRASEIEKKLILGDIGVDLKLRIVLQDLQRVRYRTGICHLCRGVTPTIPSRNMHGDAVTKRYYPYIMAEAIRSSVSTREAENRVRDRLGIPRIGEGWVSETQLHNQVRMLFPRLRVEREASPEWLGNMRFDIFLPGVGVAVEYQAEQHFRPVELFGGEEGFAKTRERDLEKRRLAREAGVEIVEFRHDEVLTDEDVRERIASAIESKRAEWRA